MWVIISFRTVPSSDPDGFMASSVSVVIACWKWNKVVGISITVFVVIVGIATAAWKATSRLHLAGHLQTLMGILTRHKRRRM